MKDFYIKKIRQLNELIEQAQTKRKHNVVIQLKESVAHYQELLSGIKD